MAVGSEDLNKLALLLKPGMKVSTEIHFALRILMRSTPP